MPLLILLLMWESGCVTAPSRLSGSVCPEPVPYTSAQMTHAASELETLPPDSALALFIVDYGAEREKLRACRGSK